MERKKTREYIICAAVHYDDGEQHPHQPVESGFVIGGWRHHNCIQVISCIMPKKQRMEQDIEGEEGFLTSHGRFVEREEALDIALREGQVEEGKTITKGRLFSEDLYRIYE